MTIDWWNASPVVVIIAGILVVEAIDRWMP